MPESVQVYVCVYRLFPDRKPETGVRYLVAGQFVDDRPSSVARFLLTRKGLSKQMIGDYLGNLQRPFNMEVLRYELAVSLLSGLMVKRRFKWQYVVGRFENV